MTTADAQRRNKHVPIGIDYLQIEFLCLLAISSIFLTDAADKLTP
jgi:hypothetical protein